MAKSLYSCPNCGRSVTKVVRKHEKQTMVRVFGAVVHFDCGFCEENLLTGMTKDGMVVITQKHVDKVEEQKRMERFDPCI